MKNRGLLILLAALLFLAVTATARVENVSIDSAHFPDENFKSYILENIDQNKNMVLDQQEIENTTELLLSGKQIQSLQGIEYFSSLVILNCSSNDLTSLDVSNNVSLTELSCSYNKLKSLDISSNSALTSLDCCRNNLTGLDVSSALALTNLDCSSNYSQFTSLKVSGASSLVDLKCGYNNLTSLDISSNPALTSLDCNSNNLTSLDVSNNVSLTELSCSHNELTSLDISSNPTLTSLVCSSNKLTSLDVSNALALTNLDCSSNHNQFTSLKVSGASSLVDLNCSYNNLTSLDISNNTSLTSLYCYYNKLTSLDISQNPALTSLYCSENKLTSLDVSGALALTDLSCSGNQLSSLKLSGAKNLMNLNCSLNKLTSLDISDNSILNTLDCSGNRLRELDVSGNPGLTSLSCANNQLKSLNVSGNNELTSLNCADNQLASLDVSCNLHLNSLYCSSNRLSSLDISNNPLDSLYCNSNLLTSLDISNNSELHYLSCSSNRLTSLDISGIRWISTFYCSSNQLSIVSNDGMFDLSTLPGFNVSRASNWQGGTVEGNLLSVTESGNVTYAYDCGKDKSEIFTLQITLLNGHSHYANCDNKSVCAICGEPYDGDDIRHDFVICRDREHCWEICNTCGEISYYQEHWAWCTSSAVCAFCGANSKTSGFNVEIVLHDYDTNYEIGEKYHYTHCLLCGRKIGFGHSYVKCTDPAESRVCKECGGTEADGVVFSISHGELVYQHDDEYHWKVCADCGEERSTHSLHDSFLCTNPNTCSVCGAFVEQPDEWFFRHENPIMFNDENEHWWYCDKCGQTFDRGSHWALCTSPETCNQCGITKTIEMQVLHLGGVQDDVWLYDETSHWIECVKCHGKVDLREHRAQCNNPDVCLDCGATKEQGINIANVSHVIDWENPFQFDAVEHWRVCLQCDEKVHRASHRAPCDQPGVCFCGATIEEGCIIEEIYHDWGEWEVTKEATTKEAGERRRVCKTDISHIETEVIPRLEEPDEPDFVPGDVGGDGVVDGRDLLRLAKYVVGNDIEIDEKAADVTGDGKVDGRDVLRLAKQLAGM